ncbi:MAG: gluconeogenesis factor YvcK family protein [Acidimicrobiales bacterium]
MSALERARLADGGPYVVAVGGGHGLAATLQAVRTYAGRITAVVSVADDGGSSGRLRPLGLPAPGDLRRCLVALAPEGSVWSDAFAYRFTAGELEGHALGNLIIAGLAGVTGDFASALDHAAELLGTVGRVLPATEVPVSLKADVGGREVVGQVKVAEAGGLAIGGVSLVPPDPPAPEEVLRAVADADQVVIGPGSLFTSVLAACVVPGIRDALAARSGGRVYVCNLRPQVPETDGFEPVHHLDVLLAHGITVDTMVCHHQVTAETEWRAPADHGVEVVAADVAREEGDGHDPQLLGGLLRRLATGA